MPELTDKDLEFIEEIIGEDEFEERPDEKIGDFLVRYDYGISAYYEGKGGDVEIPAGIDGRAEISFNNAKSITSLHYPGTFKTVSNPQDFKSKDKVTKLVFDEGVERIEGINATYCFTGYKNLTEVSLPSTLTYLDHNAFKNSPWYEQNLEEEGGCRYLRDFLVDSDPDITDAYIREGTVMICHSAFKNRTSLKTVKIPSTVKTIENVAFNGCASLEEVEIPDGVKDVKAYAFTRCEMLTDIRVSDACSVRENSFVDQDSRIPKYAHLPYTLFEKTTDPGTKDFFAICYLTCKDTYDAQIRAEYDTYIKSRRRYIVPRLLEENRHDLLSVAAPAVLDNKNIDGFIDQAQKSRAVEAVAFLMDYKERKL